MWCHQWRESLLRLTLSAGSALILIAMSLMAFSMSSGSSLGLKLYTHMHSVQACLTYICAILRT